LSDQYVKIDASTSADASEEAALSQITSDAELARRALAVIPGGVNSGQRRVPGLEGLIVVATEGATFRDASCRTFADYHAAFGPPRLGHNDPDIDRAVSWTARDVGLMGVGVTPVEIELAERLVELVPSVERVLLTSTGSEAAFHALRLARAATGRRKIVKFQGCFHGWHDSVAMNVISRADRVGQKDLLSAGILPEVMDATIVLPFNDLGAVEAELERQAAEIAAIILEPLPHNIGAVLPKPGFLEGLRRLCNQRGIVLIFDEVITGFRHGLGGYQAIAGVKPDLTALGKAMANGYPIGALGGRADLMELFSTPPGQPVFFAGTFNGHPATAAASLATIEKLERESVHDHVFALDERTRRELADLFASLDIPAVVSGFGSVWVSYFLEPLVDSYEDLPRNDTDLFVGYRLELLKHGIFELPLNLKRNHFSFAHRESHVDELAAATEQAVRAILDRRKAS
jgi:glutamate-1-semialdehyde 2,1-aminomutase